MSLRIGGLLTNDRDSVGAAMADHLNKIHATRGCDKNPIFTSQIVSASNPIGDEIVADEVLAAIKKLRKNSSPGIDGFVPGFYKRYGEKIAPYLAMLYNNILGGESPPNEFKTAIIRFIAKKGADTTEPKGWRPISLLNVDFKLLTAILATRLQTVLSQMTTNLAYVPGRFIIENVINLDASFKLETVNRYILLTDFVAAFDSLSHDWIIHVVENSGLGNHFIKAVKFLLKDMVALPIIGVAQMNFKINLNAGVRQGDPLSGLLFNLCIEPLIRAVSAFNSLSLAYADDLAFVIKTKEEAIKLIQTIRSFEKTSGLKLNSIKSKLVEISNGFPTGNFEGINFVSSFDYLGYGFNHDGIDQCFLIAKLDLLTEKLNNLKNLNLCLSQKVVVLNTYIFSGLYYYLWASTPSPLFFKLCDKIQRWFMGVSKDRFDQTKTYSLHMALTIFKKPKSHGGFGLVDLKTKSMSFKWKLLERYRTVESPFRTLIFSQLKTAQSLKKNNVLSQSKKCPSSALGYAREIIQGAILLKPSFQATELDEVFTPTTITLPKIVGLADEGVTEISPTRELALRMLHCQRPFDELRDGQKALQLLCPSLNYDTVWKEMYVFRKLRPAVKSFLRKMFNAGIFLPTSCPLCNVEISTSSTLHFVTCPVVLDTLSKLCTNASLLDFLSKPANTFKKEPVFPLLLYVMYCVCMNIVYDGDKHVDFIPRVKLRLESEMKRRDYKFH